MSFLGSLIKSIQNDDLNTYFDNQNIQINPHNLATILKNVNKKTPDILWNDSELTEKLMEENIEAIKEYDVKQVQNGYYCSTCDPFLFLLADYLEITIIHNYNNHIMNYSHKNNNRYTIKINSDRGHCC